MKTQILRAAVFTPGPHGTWGLPLLLWGAPGIAKSAAIRALGASCGMAVEVLSPASRGEGAFGVVPVPERGRITYPPPDWTDKFTEAKRGIVFVDEMNLAAQHFKGSLLGLLQDRVVGSHYLGGGIRLFAAANPVDIAAASGGWDLAAPEANRVGHIEWTKPSAKDWSRWLLADVDEVPASSDPALEEARVLALWPAAWARARGAVAGFIGSRESFLHDMPRNGSAELSRAWPSHRTWEYATRALASAQVHQLSEVDRNEFVSAFIGDGASGEFFTWLAEANLPDSEALLDGVVGWTFRVERLDIASAVLGGAVAACVGTADLAQRRARGMRAWALLAQGAKDAPDVLVPLAKTLVRARIFANSRTTLAEIGQVLEAAGIKTVDGDSSEENAA